MSDVLREIDEELKRDRLVALWKRYGLYLVASVVLVVGSVAGYVAWDNWQQSRQEAETAEFFQLVTAAEQGNAEAIDGLGALAEDFSGSRRDLALMTQASLLVERGDTAAAADIYERLALGAEDRGVRDMATVLAVMHRLGEADPDALLEQIAPVTTDDSPWRYSAREVEAIVHIEAGNREQALEILESLAEDPNAPQGVSARAERLAAVHRR